MSATKNKKLILDMKHCIAAIEKEIERFAAYFDIKITPARRYLLASEAHTTWFHDSILDICTAIRNGTRGQHGTTYKTLTPATINEWMADHIDIKYQQKEATMVTTDNKPLPWKTREEYLAASKIGEAPKEETNNEYFKAKQEYFKKRKENEK